MLKGKKVILGVTGSIAAYKSALIVRLLVKQGADVQVVMTEAATQFIGEITLSTLSQKPVLIHAAENGQWNNHVALGRNADVMLIAPASANTMAGMRSGLCNNLLLATYLSADCPVFIAPAMDVDMWKHPATKRNLDQLLLDGVHLLDVNKGELASGLHGEGRMAEPEDIVQALNDFFSAKQVLKGKNALVTAGPTYEPIDPVRYIGNHSSGKMGIALAEALADLGAKVTLVLGPSAQQPPVSSKIRVQSVTTAIEMQLACQQYFPSADITVLAAAVADYRPAKAATGKIKKTEDTFTLTLEKNPDILKELGRQKKNRQVLAGFALETENEERNAVQKLKNKQLDLIALNSLNDKGAGFNSDTNKVTLFLATGRKIRIPLLPKAEVAKIIARELTRVYEKGK